MVTGYWLLGIGYWLFVTGYWLLFTGSWSLLVGYWLLVIGIRILVNGGFEIIIWYLNSLHDTNGRPPYDSGYKIDAPYVYS